MNTQSRRISIVTLAMALVVLGWLYRPTFISMAATWWGDAAYTYGFAIGPIALWLAWQRRHWLERVEFVPSWWGTAVVLGAAMLWVVAHGIGVLVVEQFAVVTMVPALVLTTLGGRAVRALLFPLAYLAFMVPFGRAVVPWLAQATADVATWALQVSGIPVWRSHTYISIPDGRFEVAKACSGVAFLMTSVVLGVLYAHLNFTSWKKRALFATAAIAIPVIANGVRVYITIAISHLTRMQFGPGVEHVTFAQVFFIVVMLLVGWIGLRWRDSDASMPVWLEALQRAGASRRIAAIAWLPAVAAVALLAAAPPYQEAFAARLRDRMPDAMQSVRLPAARDPWRGPVAGEPGWRPLYRGGLVELQGTYRRGEADRVDSFVAVYGLGTTVGAEMISHDNVLFAEEHVTVPEVAPYDVDVEDGRSFVVREVRVPTSHGDYLVWHWYMFGDRSVTNPYVVKSLEAMAWLTREAATERSVTLATPLDERARERLQAFVTAHPECVASGFSTGACGE
jgi:exosortase A